MPTISSGSFKPMVMTEAELPAANTMTGVTVYLSDINELVWSNGTAWISADEFVAGARMTIVTAGAMPTINNALNGQLIRLNVATPTTVTLPNDVAVGVQFSIMQNGSGQITIAAGAGATLRANSGTKTAQQYAAIILTCIGNSNGTSAEWWLSGEATV